MACMLTYTLKPHTDTPLYEQLIQRIKEDISSGALRTGEKLPSKRSLAGNLGISTITVETAYQQLTAEGYITSAPRRGYFVADIQYFRPVILSENVPASVSGDRKPGRTAASVSSDRKAGRTAAASPLYKVDFSATETARENFPFTVWARLSRAELSGEPSRLVATSPGIGIRELREAISMHLQSFRGIHCDPENIVVGAGTEYLYGLLIQLLGFERIYGVEDPGYRKVSRVYDSYGVPFRFLPMDILGTDTETLAGTGIEVLHTSPSHHFPTGRIMPIRERNLLLQWAAVSDRYIIEDDYDSEFRMVGQPIPSLYESDPYGRVIYMNTFTKTLASTVRISYMVLPDELMHRLQEQLSFYSCTVSNFEQYTLTRFLSGGYFERHLNRMRNYYRAKRDRILKILQNSTLADRMKIREEDSGLHFLMELEMNISDEAFRSACAESHIRITPLSRYYHDPASAPQHIFVINYSSLDEEALPEAAECMAKLLKGNPV